MILKTMNDQELLEELRMDTKQIHAHFGKEKYAAYRRAVLRTTHFPVSFTPYEKVSRNKNRWMVFPEAFTRKDAKSPSIPALCRLESSEGTYWYSVGTHLDVLYEHCAISVITPHLIKRVKERLQINPSGLFALQEIFKQLNSKSPIELRGNQLMIRSQQGLIFGEKKGLQYIFKTFIPHQMLNRIQQKKSALLKESYSIEENELINLFFNQVIDEAISKRSKNEHVPKSFTKAMNDLHPILVSMGIRERFFQDKFFHQIYESSPKE